MKLVHWVKITLLFSLAQSAPCIMCVQYIGGGGGEGGGEGGRGIVIMLRSSQINKVSSVKC